MNKRLGERLSELTQYSAKHFPIEDSTVSEKSTLQPER